MKLRYGLLLIGLMLLSWMPTTGWAQTAHQQDDSNRVTSAGTNIHTWNTGLGILVNGDTVGGVVLWKPTTVNLTSVTVCGGTNVATLYSNPTTVGSLMNGAIFVFSNLPSGGCQIVAHYDASTMTDSRIVMHDVSGVDLTNPVTGTPSCNAQSAVTTGTDLVVSGATTPAFDGSYVMGVTGSSGGSGQIPGVNEAWVQRQNSTTRESEDLVQGTAAAITAKFTASAGGDSWVTCVLALKDASAGGGGGSSARNLMMLGVGN